MWYDNAVVEHVGLPCRNEVIWEDGRASVEGIM